MHARPTKVESQSAYASPEAGEKVETTAKGAGEGEDEKPPACELESTKVLPAAAKLAIACKRLRLRHDLADRRTAKRLANPGSDSSEHERNEIRFEVSKKKIRLAESAIERAEILALAESDFDVKASPPTEPEGTKVLVGNLDALGPKAEETSTVPAIGIMNGSVTDPVEVTAAEPGRR